MVEDTSLEGTLVDLDFVPRVRPLDGRRCADLRRSFSELRFEVQVAAAKVAPRPTSIPSRFQSAFTASSIPLTIVAITSPKHAKASGSTWFMTRLRTLARWTG